ncbi:acyltransferase [Acidobacterium sp. S8]|uniref:acyltransferase family protein n=1 Tax=Acidobacterium sp. S8 TaxID=1641854 RepID=UPI00131E7CD6|nr:acyltransferase [Acidobacterium sp. S8]
MKHYIQQSEFRFRGYIAEFDGLRALAVMLVLLVHFGPSARAGSVLWKLESVGWCGVDLFFVLSGFLITGILLDSRDKENYYRQFYFRRTLRIFPLYYAVLFAGLFARLVFHEGSVLRNLFDVSWFSAFLGNFLVAFRNRMSSAVFLNPFWSLQIEEQFYLLFPFIVKNLHPTALFRVLIVIIVVSTPLRWGLYIWFPHRALLQYVSTPCHCDGLAFGALLALSLRTAQWRVPSGYVTLVTAALLTTLGMYFAWAKFEWDTPRIRILDIRSSR